MNELVPSLVHYRADGQTPNTKIADAVRIMVATRAAAGSQAQGFSWGSLSAANTKVWPFTLNGSPDLTVDGSGTAKVFTLAPPVNVRMSVVVLLMITTAKPVFNGASFGGQYQGGLLGTTTITPGALSNGLILQTKSAGVTSTGPNLVVNEDFLLGQTDQSSGSVPGGSYLLRGRFDVNQVLQTGTSDQMTITVRDNLTNRGITEVRAVAFGATV